MNQFRSVLARNLGRRVLPVGLALAVGYAAYPYLVLFQLGQAIRHGDATVLERLVDWDGVREGLKEDVCDDVADTPPAQAQAVKSGETLAPFGFSFVRGIARNMIDENVNPAGVVAAAQQAGLDQLTGAAPRAVPSDEASHIVWAFFDSLTTFTVLVSPAERGGGMVRLEMEQHGGAWKVMRVWLPHDLLMRANTRI